MSLKHRGKEQLKAMIDASEPLPPKSQGVCRSPRRSPVVALTRDFRP